MMEYVTTTDSDGDITLRVLYFFCLCAHIFVVVVRGYRQKNTHMDMDNSRRGNLDIAQVKTRNQGAYQTYFWAPVKKKKRKSTEPTQTTSSKRAKKKGKKKKEMRDEGRKSEVEIG